MNVGYSYIPVCTWSGGSCWPLCYVMMNEEPAASSVVDEPLMMLRATSGIALNTDPGAVMTFAQSAYRSNPTRTSRRRGVLKDHLVQVLRSMTISKAVSFLYYDRFQGLCWIYKNNAKTTGIDFESKGFGLIGAFESNGFGLVACIRHCHSAASGDWGRKYFKMAHIVCKSAEVKSLSA